MFSHLLWDKFISNDCPLAPCYPWRGDACPLGIPSGRLLFLVWLCCLGAFICYYCSLSLVAFSNSHTLLQEDGCTDTDCALKRIFLALTSAPSTLPLCNPWLMISVSSFLVFDWIRWLTIWSRVKNWCLQEVSLCVMHMHGTHHVGAQIAGNEGQ